jgi:predicted phage terminase large subunit-like protein
MKLSIELIGKYFDFFEETKNEPLIILQGSKRSGKTFSILQKIGIDFLQSKNKKFQCFSESPKQQNFGLISDFQNIFNPILHKTKANSTQKTFAYQGNQLAFINIADNIAANDIANSLGACDIRYINECNTFSRDTVEKLRINNRGQFFFDYNPYRKFWIDELITDTNFLKTTWKDNPFLTKNQVDLFLEWTLKGQNSEIGSYNYWRWQVLCEGNYSDITGEIFTTENIHFVDKKTDGLHNFIIFADPSNARGGDNFALTLTATDTAGKIWLIDSMSRNKIEKVLMAERIREWQRDFPVQRTLIETNGQIGLKFFNDCISSGIPVEGWYSRQDKYERIMSNFDVITQKLIILDTPQNRDFANQIYTFKIDCDYDDNIDCLNNAIMAYIMIYNELKILF